LCPADAAAVESLISLFLAERIKGAQYLAMQGVGHFAYLEDPEKFRNAILPFLLKEAK